MTIEQIELRKLLSQMLADNGINRETIVPMVRDVIQEKMDKTAKQIAEETNLDDMVRHIIEREIADAVRSEVRAKVKNCFSSISVSIEMQSRG
jgi:hypothetical protein